MQKILFFTASSLLALTLSPLRASHYATKKSYNHNHHLYDASKKKGCSLSEPYSQLLLSHKAFLSTPSQTTVNQLQDFRKKQHLKDADKTNSSNGTSKAYFEHPLFTALIVTILLTDCANACFLKKHLKPTVNCIKKAGTLGIGGLSGVIAAGYGIWRTRPLFQEKKLSKKHPGQIKKVVTMLGYDPQFRAYKSGRPLYKGQLATKIKNGATGILGAHGFGDRNLADRIWLRGNFVSMGANFRDARDYLPLGLRFTNLGQAPDASVLLYELVKCHQLGLKKLVGFGHSRGGAAFITLLHMLTFPERYKKYFRAMGLENTDGSLNSKKITQLKQMIDQIILAHPLVSVPSTLRHQLGKLGSGAKLLLTLFGDYNLFEKTQLAMLEELYTSKNQSALTPLAISLSPHDEVIGTVHNRDLQMIADKSQGSITIFGEVDSFRHDDLGPALQLLTALTTKS